MKSNTKFTCTKNIGIHNLSDTHVTSLASAYQKAFHDCFVLLNMALSIGAWLLFLSTMGTTTPLVATLFILSEVVFVIKESINLSLFHWYDMPTVDLNANSGIQRNQTRLVLEIETHKDRSWMNLMSALWLTGIIAGWCIMPNNLIVGVVSLLALGIVHWKQYNDLDQIETDMARKLQDTADNSIPWWVDDRALRIESVVQNDVIVENGASPIDRFRDWHHEETPSLGLVSQSGMFSRTIRPDRASNNEPMADSSARSTVGYDWLAE